ELDLATVNFDGQTVTVLLGNGKGTFAPAPGSPVAVTNAPDPNSLVAGDFNGDGRLDLAVGSFGNDTVAILLGKGDGTFTQVNGCCGTPVGLTRIFSMAAGDLNGDGKLDLVLGVQNADAGYAADYVSTMLGNGDGTFT